MRSSYRSRVLPIALVVVGIGLLLLANWYGVSKR